MSKVCIRGNELGAGFVIPVEALAHDKDVISLSEGISVVSNGLDDDLRLVSDSLVGGGAIVVPVGDVLKAGDLVGKGAALGAEGETRSVDPDVFSDDATVLRKVEKFLGVLVVKVCHSKIWASNLII